MQKADFDHVVEVIDQWWGGPGGTLAHPIFFYELGELASVAVEDGVIIGFLLGFIGALRGAASQPATEQVGYVHLVGIHPAHRRQNVGRVLYERFFESCISHGCTRVKAISTLGNDAAMRFHSELGFSVSEVDDYAGPSRKRIVFMKDFKR